MTRGSGNVSINNRLSLIFDVLLIENCFENFSELLPKRLSEIVARRDALFATISVFRRVLRNSCHCMEILFADFPAIVPYMLDAKPFSDAERIVIVPYS